MFKKLKRMFIYMYLSILYFFGLFQEKILYLSILIRNKQLFKKKRKLSKEEIEHFRQLLKELSKKDER